MSAALLRAALPWAAPLALILSALDVLPTLVAGAGRSGVQWASPFALALGLGGAWRVSRRPELRRRLSPLARPLGLFVVAALLSAAFAARPAVGALWALRIALAGGAVIGLLALGDDNPVAARTARLGAAGLIALWGLVWLCGLIAPGAREVLWEIGPHQYVGAMDRFRGLADNPTVSGLTLLAAVALVQGMPTTRTRRLLTGAGLTLAALSFGIVTLAIPLALILWGVPGRRSRRALATCWVVGAALVLYVHPLTLTVGDARHEAGTLRPEYHQGGLGPIHMPVRTVEAGPLGLSYHATHYWKCVEGNLACFATHPVLGVGGLNFPNTCPVTSMETYGTWSTGRRPHNQYLGILSEFGVLGALAFLWLVTAFLRRTSPPPGGTFARCLLWAYLLCGLQGDNVIQLPFALWLGAWLQLRPGPGASAEDVSG